MFTRFKILTTTCTPFDSSNVLRAGEQSTRMHNKVSKIADASGIDVGAGVDAVVCDDVEDPDEPDLVAGSVDTDER